MNLDNKIKFDKNLYYKKSFLKIQKLLNDKKFKRNILNESIKIKDAIDLFNKLEKKF